MTASYSGDENSRLYCWEQVSRTNRLFRVSRVFAPRDCADRLLPLYGLFSVVEQICSRQTDEDIARSKLNWWRNEFLQNGWATSRHPLAKEMNRTGASEHLQTESLNRLFDSAGDRLSATAPKDLEALKSLCIDLYAPQLELELTVSAPGLSPGQFDSGLLARNGALQLLRESVQGEGQACFWWAPLNLLARYGIGRDEIKNQPDGLEVGQFWAEVLREFHSWGSGSDESGEKKALDFSLARHVFAISSLYTRKLQSLASVSPVEYSVELTRLRRADLLEAWKRARRAC